MSKRTVHTHTSSRFDRSAVSLEAALDLYMQDSDLITVTEVAAEQRENKLAERGWDYITGDHGGGDDAGIAWKRSVWPESIYATTIQLSSIVAPGRSDIYGAVAVLEHQCGATAVVICVHMPAGVEAAGGFRKGYKYVIWLATQRKLKKEANRLKRKFNADAVIIAADWNINIKMKWVQAWFKANFPRYKITWDKPYPRKGTHHRRIIDLTLVRGAIKIVKQARLRKHHRHSDHTAYTETLAFT